MSFLKKLLEIVLKRKILFFTLVFISITVFFLLIFFQKEGSLKIGKEGAESGFINLRVEIPPGAFGKQKVLKITRLSDEERKLYPDVFVGDLYRVEFADGVDEFALKPIRLKYYFDAKYLRGENYNNLTFAYATEDGGYRIIPGSMIGKDERGYYVEAFTYHLSVFGVVLRSAGFQKHGIRLLREAVNSSGPAVLLVPGEDPTFEGVVKDNNIWETIFPDRTIMTYEYALYEPRSLAYSEMYRSFIEKEGRRSFIDFESDFLSQEILKYSQYEFDILAYGTGGLIVLRMLQRHPEVNNVRKVVLLSTPVQGTNVVNPLYFSSIFYGKDPEVLEDIFGIEWTKLKMLTLHIRNLIDTLGEVVQEILPDSQLVKELREFARNDVEIVSICGDTPPYGVDVSGTELERFYPEFVKGRGDGFVSIQSCRVGKVEQLSGNFYDLYSREENVAYIRKLLKYEVQVFSGFRSDDYEEYLPSKNPELSEESVQKVVEAKETKGTELSVLPVKILFENFLERIRSLELSSYLSGALVGKEVYIATESGVFAWDKKVFDKKIEFFKKVEDYASFVDEGDIFIVDNIGIKKYAPFPLVGDISDALITRNAIIYARVVPGGVRYYLFRNGAEKLLATSPGTTVRMKSENGNYLLITDGEVVAIGSDFKEKGRVLSSLFGEKVKIVDASFKDDAFYILLNDGSIAFVSSSRSETKNYGLTVPKKVLNFQGRILVVYDGVILDLSAGKAQRFDRGIIDVFPGNEGLFIVFDEKVRVSVEEWRLSKD